MRFRHGLLAIAIAVTTGLSVLGWQHTRPVTLPEPTGPFAVGRTEFDWRDRARIDPLAPAAGTLRELTVWMWYPASRGTSGDTAAYMPGALRSALLHHMGPLLRLLSHDLAQVRAHAIHNAPIARDQASYPVVLFKPGIGALALDYTTFAEDLASHGFVVVASDSPYSTAVVVYQDGREVHRTRAGHPMDEGLPSPPREAIEKILVVWVADNRFLLNQLEQLNAAGSGPFSHRFDLASIGAFGHSFGGATALQFCVDEPRCKAAIDIDGAPFGDVSQRPVIDRPFLFLLSDHAADRSPEDGAIAKTIQSMRGRLHNDRNYIVVAGSRHFNFSDQALTKNTPVARAVGMLGPIDARRALAIAAGSVSAFFDRYLKKNHSPT